MATKANHAAIYRRVPAFLRQMREEAGLTQRQLAKRIRQSLSWVHRCETGSRRVDVAEFIEFCEGCDVDPTTAFKSLAVIRR